MTEIKKNTDDAGTIKSMLLDYVCPGYEPCRPPALHSILTQTNISMSDLEFQNYIRKIEDLEEFHDVIESEDDEFFSIPDETSNEPHSQESPSEIAKLTVRKEDIEPLGNIISNELSDQKQESSQDFSFRATISQNEFEPYLNVPRSCLYPCDDLTMALRTLALGIVEQEIKTKSMRVKLSRSGLSRMLRNPKEYYPSTYRSINKSKHKLHKKFQKPIVAKRNLSQNLSRIKKTLEDMDPLSKFEWIESEGDPVELLQNPQKEELRISLAVQTDVHINPNYVSEESTEESDSLLKKKSLLTAEALSSMHDHSNAKDTSMMISHQGTTGQIESDLSSKTEPTLEGVPELTDKTANGDMIQDSSEFEITKREKMDVTEEDIDTSDEEAYGRMLETTKNIDRRSKLIDTEDLEDTKNEEFTFLSSRPSLLKILKDFEEELTPLKTELSRIHSEYKNIDIPAELKQDEPAKASGRVPQPIYGPVPFSQSASTHSSSSYHPPAYTSLYDFYRKCGFLPPQQTNLRLKPCSCPPRTCLGLHRSSGFECQRIKRLSPNLLPSEFQREFLRPFRNRNDDRINSVWSEPEDILGGPSQRREGPSSSENNAKSLNKSDKSYVLLIELPCFHLVILSLSFCFASFI